jgi:ATP-dependent protease ClpP protease subunit
MSKFIQDNINADQLEVEIHSDGGSVTQGFEIYDLLKNSGKKVKTIAYKANSIATVIFLAGEERVITKNAQFVIHNPFIDPMNLGFDGLTADDLFAIADDIKKCEDKIFNLYNEVLSLDENSQIEIRNLMKADTDLTADNALKFGFATSIINGGVATLKSLKNTAYTDKIAALIKTKNNNNMSDNKEVNSKLDAIASKLKNLFKAQNLTEEGEPMKVKNSTATAKDGSVMYFTEEALVAGIAVFSDEAMTTPIPVYVTNGLVEKIELLGEDMKKKMAALENENSTLKTELENLKAENLAVKNQATETVNQLKELNTEFQNLKKIIPNDVKNLSTKNNIELSPAQKQSLKRKEMMNLGK